MEEKEDVEQWKEIKGYTSYYVSSFGRVKSVKRKNTIFKDGTIRSSYLCVSLYDENGKGKLHQIHRLVAENFLENPNNLPIVDHIDRNKKHNYLKNLRWVSYSDSAKNTTRKEKKIYQYDKPGKLIKEWNSLDDIIEEHKDYDKKLMEKSIAKNTLIYNYRWKYHNDFVKNTIKSNGDEIFKNIGVYKGHDFSKFEVSNYGNIRSLHTDELRSLTVSSSGYYRMTLTDATIARKTVTVDVHCLVAFKFIENPLNLPQVHHKDENKLNDHIDNLEWCTGLNNQIKSKGTKIAKVDPVTNKVLKVYDSLSSANKDMGKKGTEISIVCRGRDNRTSCYGYKWKYV